MVTRQLSIRALTLAVLVTSISAGLADGGGPLPDSAIIVSDDFAEMNQPLWTGEEQFDGVRPAQFQVRSRSRAGSRTSTRLAAGDQQSAAFGEVHLANTPKMMGDFFSLPGQTAILGELFTDGGEHEGLAVHQTMGPLATNRIAIITTDSGTSKTVFLGGPALLTPRSFFDPPIDLSDIQNPQSGLTLDGDSENSYTAVLTGDTTNVFDNPADLNPTIPNAPVYQVFQLSQTILPGANPGDIVGRVRVQDNNNALPQDRIILDYNYFHNVPFAPGGIDVHRLSPGLEKTFLNGLGSIEVRVPMAVTFNSDQWQGNLDISEPEFGNLTVIPKLLLASTDQMALAVGMGVSLPTADDINFAGQSGAALLSIENEAVHLVPFLGYLFTPANGDSFFQSFVTVDVDTNGNAVRADIGSGSLEHIGDWNDQTLISASGTYGRYLYQNYSRNSSIKSLSLVGELHYTTTVSDADVVSAGPFVLGDADRQIDVLNATFGGHMRLKDSTLSTGYTVPLTSERIFDGELRVFINQFF